MMKKTKTNQFCIHKLTVVQAWLQFDNKVRTNRRQCSKQHQQVVPLNVHVLKFENIPGLQKNSHLPVQLLAESPFTSIPCDPVARLSHFY